MDMIDQSYVKPFLTAIKEAPNKDAYFVKKYSMIVKKEILSLRSTAYLLRGRNIAGLCNHMANQLEKELKKVLE